MFDKCGNYLIECTVNKEDTFYQEFVTYMLKYPCYISVTKDKAEVLIRPCDQKTMTITEN